MSPWVTTILAGTLLSLVKSAILRGLREPFTIHPEVMRGPAATPTWTPLLNHLADREDLATIKRVMQDLVARERWSKDVIVVLGFEQRDDGYTASVLAQHKVLGKVIIAEYELHATGETPVVAAMNLLTPLATRQVRSALR